MKYAVITDTTVGALYGKEVASHFGAQLFTFPPGEKNKSRETKAALEDSLIAAGFSKETTLIGLGGGVVTDVTGFLAATFCRGVPLILIPTTLMAMVDAAIGGKNAVNTPLGKNMIGTLYDPTEVIWDLNFLKTLPEEEMRNGLVETVKHALIYDGELLKTLDIAHSIEVKRRIIASDATDSGLRRILNFGHTIGHALETLSDYELSHGKAVALGIRLESELSYQLGILGREALEVVRSLFPESEIPFSAEEVMSAMRRDKKSSRGRARFVLLKDIGEVLPCGGEFCAEVDEAILKEVLDAAHLCPV